MMSLIRLYQQWIFKVLSDILENGVNTKLLGKSNVVPSYQDMQRYNFGIFK